MATYFNALNPWEYSAKMGPNKTTVIHLLLLNTVNLSGEITSWQLAASKNVLCIMKTHSTQSIKDCHSLSDSGTSTGVPGPRGKINAFSQKSLQRKKNLHLKQLALEPRLIASISFGLAPSNMAVHSMP